MDQARPIRKLLDWKPMGSRPVGKPRQRWQEDVMEDLKKLKVKKRNVYLSSLMMKVPDHIYVLG
jgi:hypothetical protein